MCAGGGFGDGKAVSAGSVRELYAQGRQGQRFPSGVVRHDGLMSLFSEALKLAGQGSSPVRLFAVVM